MKDLMLHLQIAELELLHSPIQSNSINC